MFVLVDLGLIVKSGEGQIEFSVVSDGGECQLPGAFYWIKKHCS